MSHRFLISRFIGCLTALTTVVLSGCAVGAMAPSSELRCSQAFWRLRPVDIQSMGELKTCDRAGQLRYIGIVAWRHGLLSVEMNRTRRDAPDSHLAVAHSWAGSQKIIYAHQPTWALEFVRDLYRVLHWPSEIKTIHIIHPGVQESTVHLPNGDVEKLYFMGLISAPWRVTVIRPNRTSVTALLRWAPDLHLHSIYLRDVADGRRWIIILRRRAGVEKP